MGVPNCAFDPRKLVFLETMLRNRVECVSGFASFQDVVMNLEHQHMKKCQDETSSLPNLLLINTHVAEALRQVKGTWVLEERWVDRDVWFGIAVSCVEIRKKCKDNSSFIVNNNAGLLPMKVSHNVVDARYENYPSGH